MSLGFGLELGRLGRVWWVVRWPIVWPAAVDGLGAIEYRVKWVGQFGANSVKGSVDG